MPVSIKCPSCKATLRLDEKHLGKKIQCAGCKNLFVAAVTKPAEAPLPAEIVEEPPPAAIVEEPLAAETVNNAPPDPATAIQTGQKPPARLKPAVPPPLAKDAAEPAAKPRPPRRLDRKRAPAGLSALFLVLLLLGVGGVVVVMFACVGGFGYILFAPRPGNDIAQNQGGMVEKALVNQKNPADPDIVAKEPLRPPVDEPKDPFNPKDIKGPGPEPKIAAPPPGAAIVAQFPPHDPAALAVKPCKLEAEKVTRMLPGAIDDIAVAGGGRFILFNIPTLSKIGMFDVNEGKIVHYFPTAGENAKFSAGMTKLVVVYPDTRVLQRWDLLSKAKEATVPLPDIGVPRLALMGSASQGPLLLLGTREGRNGENRRFINIDTFKETSLARGDFLLNGFDPEHARVSANGAVFSSWGTGSPQCVNSFVIVGNTLKSHNAWKSMGHVTPGPDGKVLYTACGRFTAECKPINAAEGRDDYGIPAAQGDYYVTVRMADRFAIGGKKKNPSNTLTVHIGNDPRPLAAIADIIQTAPNDPLGGINRWDRERFGNDKRFIFIPNADLLVVLPFTNDRLELVRVNIDESLEKSGINYLLVASQAPDFVQRGAAYRYKVAVKSKRGGVKYKLDAGPPGMKVSADGVVSWQVAANHDFVEETVLLTISDAAGQEVFHTFKVRVVAD